MIKSSHVNKPIENPHELPSIDSSLKELITEARTLFKVLDSSSNKIRELETALGEIKAHFPFRYKIGEENESTRSIESHHRATYSCAVVGVGVKIYNYLGWESDEKSQKYRLCLISEECETIYLCSEDHYFQELGKTQILIKKPLIETDLSTRMRHSQHLLPFIESFKGHIKSARIWIEEGTDAIPF